MALHEGMILRQRYEILRALGEGGQGAAHLTRDQLLNRRCVIKEVLTDDTTSQGQLRREAELLGNLRHPNLPVVYDCIFDQNQTYTC